MEGVLHVQPGARFGDAVEGYRRKRENDEDGHGGGHDAASGEPDRVGADVESAFIGVGLLEALQAIDARCSFIGTAVARSRDLGWGEAGEEAEEDGEGLASPQPDVLAEYDHAGPGDGRVHEYE